jgi:hypothetical protein
MRLRAQTAARILGGAAQEAQAAPVGHGWFNRAIARELTSSGWRLAGPSSGQARLRRITGPWGYVIFER